MSEVKHPSHKKVLKWELTCVWIAAHTHRHRERGHGGWATTCFTIWKKTLRVCFVLFSFVYCTSIFFLSWFFFLFFSRCLRRSQRLDDYLKRYTVYTYVPCTAFHLWAWNCCRVLLLPTRVGRCWWVFFTLSLSLLPNFPIFEHVILIRRGRVHRTTWICFGPQQQPEQIGGR